MTEKLPVKKPSENKWEEEEKPKTKKKKKGDEELNNVLECTQTDMYIVLIGSCFWLGFDPLVSRAQLARDTKMGACTDPK
jgi:hypothetical protein